MIHQFECRFLRSCFFAILIGLSTSVSRGATLEEHLLKEAPRLVRTLRVDGSRHIGVLKFLVKKGSGPLSDNVGTLNISLCERLRHALVLGNPKNKNLQVELIANSNSVANSLGANHTTAAGRRRLFEGKYESVLDQPPVQADAFLTGEVKITPNLKSAIVTVQSFVRADEGKKLTTMATLRVAMTADLLNELSPNYALRGAFDDDSTKVSSAITAAVSVGQDVQERFPLKANNGIVGLEVRYGERPVPIELDKEKASVPEPVEGQKVTFVIRRTGSTAQRLGLVLKVNGENTLFRERRKDVDCSKWILEPATNIVQIAGYQKDGGTREDFRVLSDDESEAREIDYGRDVGTISLAVFREATELPPPPISDEAEDLAAIANPVFPEEKPASMNDLRIGLRTAIEQIQPRGLIAEGSESDSDIVKVRFDADPVPIMVVTIHYYRPRAAK